MADLLCDVLANGLPTQHQGMPRMEHLQLQRHRHDERLGPSFDKNRPSHLP